MLNGRPLPSSFRSSLITTAFRRTITPPLRTPLAFRALAAAVHAKSPLPATATATAAPTMVPLQRSAFFEAIQKHDPESTAIVHSLSGRSFTYGSLLHDVTAAKARLLEGTGKSESDIVGERI
ncbi:hypothetical protein LTR53_003124, partial [Teratosphaeriaceae sp. CCFEE 6253]